jgi:hypothetical protein
MDLIMEKVVISSKITEGENFEEMSKIKKVERCLNTLDMA